MVTKKFILFFRESESDEKALLACEEMDLRLMDLFNRPTQQANRHASTVGPISISRAAERPFNQLEIERI